MTDSPAQVFSTELALLLLGAALVGMLARWSRTPYVVALVIAGLGADALHLLALPQLDPGVVLFLLLPPLLFDSAFRLQSSELRRLWMPVAILAVPGTVVTAVLVGVILAVVLKLPLLTSLLFGAMVGATDPVAVVSVFRRLRAPPHLEVIVEGESLINDGVAVTLYATVILLMGGGINPLAPVVLFVQQILGGALIGAGLGFLFSRLTGAIDDHLVEMTLSTALAYGSYLVAQALGASGPLACVVAGLIHGSYGRRVGMSENTRRLLDDLWEYLGFLANAVLFLLVGFSVDLPSLLAQAWPVGIAILAVLVARALAIAVPTILLPRRSLTTTRPERIVLLWGGLRGALTIVLALGLPASTPDRSLLITLAFGVALFTLVVQGLTLPLLLSRLGLTRKDKK